MALEDCLPPDLRSSSPTITRVAAGLSGAGVYRVDAGSDAFVLKVASETDEPGTWKEKVSILRSAAEAGLAPPVVHVDEVRRAVLSRFVVDRSFPAFYGTPTTREVAVTQLGQTLRRVHDLPLPAGLPAPSPLELLGRVATSLTGFPVPAFATEAIARLRAEQAPAIERPLVLSHNDVNPTNLLFDGHNLLLLDWDMAGPNDPLYDLAAIAVFLRMDDATCLRLISAHDGAVVGSLSPRFLYQRRLVAVLCGAIFLMLARHRGHAGDSSLGLREAVTLDELHQRMRARQFDVQSADGQWAFGLALLRTGIELESP